MTPVAIATVQKLRNFALQPVEISQRYNSVAVKDNCTLFSPTPYFQAQAIQWCHVNFSPYNPCCHGNEFWDIKQCQRHYAFMSSMRACIAYSCACMFHDISGVHWFWWIFA